MPAMTSIAPIWLLFFLIVKMQIKQSLQEIAAVAQRTVPLTAPASPYIGGSSSCMRVARTKSSKSQECYEPSFPLKSQGWGTEKKASQLEGLKE